ncbi:hypothetical protein HK100_012697 [Physocladia obscura]|uniref:Nephrocystin 3-like N-terminal domain-containing protein n=1 Tax=Physocladia obscura TaxID=109957 RepID=A0AAD5T5C5_9FUNG|nr:hypothetical protein HK100_012697 [Physocladia obscura]
MDIDNIGDASADIYDEMNYAILSSEAVLKSPNCKREISHAADEKQTFIVARFFVEPEAEMRELKEKYGSSFLITAGRLYANFKDLDHTSKEWMDQFRIVAKHIRTYIPEFRNSYDILETHTWISTECLTESVRSRNLVNWPNPDNDNDDIDEIILNIPETYIGVSKKIKSIYGWDYFEVKIKTLLQGRLGDFTEGRLNELLKKQRQAKNDNPNSPVLFELWVREIQPIISIQVPSHAFLHVIEPNNTKSVLRFAEPVQEFKKFQTIYFYFQKVSAQLDFEIGVSAAMFHNDQQINSDENVISLFTSPTAASHIGDVPAYEHHHKSAIAVQLRLYSENSETSREPIYPTPSDDQVAFDSDNTNYATVAKLSSTPTDNSLLIEILMWLSPVNFMSDLEKFSQTYVSGTREKVLHAIIDWMRKYQSSTLCQLGGAGVGKTMLAWLLYSQASRFSYQVGAYFFCKHDDERKNNPRSIVSTLASQLASQFPGFLEHLVALKTDYDKKLAANPDLVSLLDNSESFKMLIVDGLHKIEFSADKTLLLIIDALDECGKQGDLNRQYLLTTIGEDCKDLPANIRLFVTSRPESDIVSILEKIDTKELRTSDYFNLLDVQIFVAEMLRRIDFDSSNPRHIGFINKIVDASEGVFVFAALACKEIAEVFVQKDLTPDHEEVDGLIDRFVQDGGGLDGIYQPLFQRVYDGATELETNMFRSVMGIVVTARVALHPDLIAFVLKVQHQNIDAVIRKV